MPSSITFLLDTNVLSAFLGTTGAQATKVSAAQAFVSSQKAKGNVLICPAFSRIELYKQRFKRHSGRAEQKRAAVSSDFEKLYSDGVQIQKTLGSLDNAAFDAVFEFAKINYGECNIGLADSINAAQAAVQNYVLVTFDTNDFRQVHHKEKLKWYNPETRACSHPAVRSLI